MKWKDGGKDFAQAPVGTHVGRCIRVLDLGTQRNEYQGTISYSRQTLIAFELPNELMDGEGEQAGQPYVVSRFYTASLNEKANLRKHLESWRGKQFSAEELQGFSGTAILGKPCMLTLISNEKGKTRITAISGLPKGMKCPPQVNKAIYFSLEDFDEDDFEGLSEGIKKMIAKSPEYAELFAKHEGKKVERPGELLDLDEDVSF